MKKYYFIALSVMFAFTLSSCEENVSGVNLPYEELLVINSIPTSGDYSIALDITKTLPPLETYSRYKAMVSDANVTIDINGASCQAEYGDDGRYYVSYSIKAGDVLKLNVKWKDKTAYATTVVPEPAQVDSLNYKIEEQNEWGYSTKYLIVYAYLQANKPAVCYQGNYSYSDYDYYDSEYANIANYDSRNSKGTVRVRTMSYMFWDNYTDIDEIVNGYKYSVDTYDNQYYAFAKTYSNSYYGNDVFESNGTNPVWNIKGDGIGIFIARAKGSKLKFK